MKPSVLNALRRLSSLSEDAAQLVDQVVPSKKLLAESSLPEKIAELQREVAVLRMELLPEEQVHSDDEIAIFTADFTTHLTKAIAKDAPQQVLSTYNRAFFIPYSKQTRVVIANALISFCSKNNFVSNSVWSDIVASLGAL